MVGIFTAFPLLIALDIAATSSRGTLLAEALNSVGMTHGEDCHLRLEYLICSLQRLNRNQGLGFEVFGVVVNKKTLNTVATGVVTAVSSVIAWLLALGSAKSSQSDSAVRCTLTLQERAAIRGLLGGSTCAGLYNVSLDSIIEA